MRVARLAANGLTALACVLLLLGCGGHSVAGPAMTTPPPASLLPTTPTASTRRPATKPVVTPAATPGRTHDQGPDRARGVLEGRVVRTSGHDPRHGGVPVGVSGDRVNVRDLNGRTVASTVTGADGRFRVMLPPGAYRVSESMCAAGGHVEVRGDATMSVTLRMLPGAC